MARTQKGPLVAPTELNGKLQALVNVQLQGYKASMNRVEEVKRMVEQGGYRREGAVCK